MKKNIMKNKNIHQGTLSFASFISLAAALLLSVSACDNKDYSNDSPFDNSVYIDAAKVKDVANFTFNNVTATGQQQISAVLAYPTDQDIEVDFQADPSLVSQYNARLGTDYTMLDAKYYKFSTQHVAIPKGEVNSPEVTIDFANLTDLTIDAGYLLPVTINQASGGMGMLSGSKTICYVVRRSSAITVAVSLTDNYFRVPGFDTGSPTAGVVNGLKQLTFEAIIRVDNFIMPPQEDISTIMGIEQYCLFRIGDAGFPRQQLQFAANEVKFPAADEGKSLQAGEWYHVAVTYDTEAKTAAIYVDGKLQSSIEDYGNGTPIDLGKQVETDGKWQKMFLIGQSYGEPNQFVRMLNGEICEVRIWNVVRTQEEIYQNMYDVAPDTPGLCAYWKFNEGTGNTAHDFTGNGNDAVSADGVNAVWPSGIEVPVKNKD